MSLICLCGLDRTGKTSVANYYETQGYEVVHLSAPDKKFFQEGYTGPSYLEEYVEMLMSFQGKKIVMDRFWDGELIWTKVYNRTPLLSEEDIEVLREIEKSMNVQYILMHDSNVEAHWKRCVDNNEPLTKAQFVLARKLYNDLASKYGFERKTLQDFPEISVQTSMDVKKTETGQTKDTTQPTVKFTKEQMKLETANAINDVLSKRIIKQKGPIYDQIEGNLRTFLNTELGKILGTKTENFGQFTAEEVEFVKLLLKNYRDKNG